MQVEHGVKTIFVSETIVAINLFSQKILNISLNFELRHFVHNLKILNILQQVF